MFTKEKLEKWMDKLNNVMFCLDYHKKTTTDTDEKERAEEHLLTLEDLFQTLEQIYTSITSDGSI